ncbi:MAG: acyltransferase [Planctomycetes bacterium]|nr:acyltransferase [Planctomycetota bacterium]
MGTPALTPNAWSITYEIWYYFITFFIVRSISHQRFNLILIPVSLAFLYFIYYLPITIYFVLGVTLAIITKDKTKKIGPTPMASCIQILSLLSIVYLTLCGVEFAHGGWKNICDNYHTVLLPISLFLFMRGLLYEDSFISKLLSAKPSLFLGNISYSLYLIHPYTYYLSRKSVEYASVETLLFTFIVFLVLAIGLSLVCSHLVNKYYENMVYNYFVKRNIYKNES